MPPSTFGTSTKPWPIVKALPPSPSGIHGHEEVPRDPAGTPRCWAGLRMYPTYPFEHTNGFRAQRFRCPLLFPAHTGETCAHKQFAKGSGCVKDPNWEKGGLMRALLDRA